MANPKPVTEPATPAVANKVTEPARTERTFDPNKRIRVRDTETGEILTHTVPETWVDGRFPNLKEVPSNKKAGK